MPNLAKIYTDATSFTKGLKDDDIPAQYNPQEEILEQDRIAWLQMPATRLLFKKLDEEIAALEQFARDGSLAYPTHQNHDQIIHALVKAATLRKIKEHGSGNR